MYDKKRKYDYRDKRDYDAVALSIFIKWVMLYENYIKSFCILKNRQP